MAGFVVQGHIFTPTHRQKKKKKSTASIIKYIQNYKKI